MKNKNITYSDLNTDMFRFCSLKKPRSLYTLCFKDAQSCD